MPQIRPQIRPQAPQKPQGPCSPGSQSPTSLWQRLNDEIQHHHFECKSHRQLAQSLIKFSARERDKITCSQPLADHLTLRELSQRPHFHLTPITPATWLKSPVYSRRFSARHHRGDTSSDHLGCRASTQITTAITDQQTPRTFLSSGTTSTVIKDQDQPFPLSCISRSRSPFSTDGLFLYKISALAGFFQCLEKTSHSLSDFHGLSLIPPLNDWPNSSLAQMIHWFSEYFSTTYINNLDEANEAVQSCPGRPTWLFATAADFLPLITATEPVTSDSPPLTAPPYSASGPTEKPSSLYIFETGGLKSLKPPKRVTLDHSGELDRGRGFVRNILYRTIATKLSVPLDHIGSEFSSCELSCQAWSFLVPGFSQAPYLAPYRFMPHVRLWVVPGEPQKNSDDSPLSPPLSDTRPFCGIGDKKIGSLIIDDPMRIDMPGPLLTEDICELSTDGGFWPYARAPRTPPRGCSLATLEHRSEAYLINQDRSFRPQNPPSPHPSSSNPSSLPPPAAYDHDLGHRRPRPRLIMRHDWHVPINKLWYERVQAHTRRLFSSPGWKNALRYEFHCPLISAEASEDLIHSLATDPASALKLSGLKDQDGPGHRSEHRPWAAVIAPTSHSIAALYPIYLLIMARYRIIVRMPEIFADRGSALMMYLQSWDGLLDQPIKTVTESWRIRTSEDLQLSLPKIPSQIIRQATRNPSALSSQRPITPAPNQLITPEKLFFFGSSKTHNTLVRATKKSRVSLAGFADSWSLSWITQKDPISSAQPLDQLFNLALRDQRHLAGRGCLSAQMLCLPIELYESWRAWTRKQKITTQLSILDQATVVARRSVIQACQVSYLSSRPATTLSTEHRSGHSSEHNSANHAENSTDYHSIWVYYLNPPLSTHQPLGPSLEQLAQPYTMATPTVFYRDEQKLILHLWRLCSQLRHISTPDPKYVERILTSQQNTCHLSKRDPDHQKILCHPLGELGRIPWDGTWEGRPLFA